MHGVRSMDASFTSRFHKLSPQEFSVLDLLVKGMSSGAIGQALGMSCRTVEHLRSEILCKTEYVNAAQLCYEYGRHNMLLAVMHNSGK